jgi:hypothetical protein
MPHSHLCSAASGGLSVPTGITFRSPQAGQVLKIRGMQRSYRLFTIYHRKLSRRHFSRCPFLGRLPLSGGGFNSVPVHDFLSALAGDFELLNEPRTPRGKLYFFPHFGHGTQRTDMRPINSHCSLDRSPHANSASPKAVLNHCSRRLGIHFVNRT